MAAVAIGGSSTGGLLGDLLVPPDHRGVIERPTRKNYVMHPSGGIEAANTSSRHVRLKRSGAWGYGEQANHLLALRCATDNGTCANVLEIDTRKALQKHRGDPL
jgi:hypothetical protein